MAKKKLTYDNMGQLTNAVMRYLKYLGHKKVSKYVIGSAIAFIHANYECVER